MRINIYDEELTGEVQTVSKVADTGLAFTGIRIYLASPDVLHNQPDDDDRSAVTFWFETDTSQEETVRGVLHRAAGRGLQSVRVPAQAAPAPSEEHQKVMARLYEELEVVGRLYEELARHAARQSDPLRTLDPQTAAWRDQPST